MKYSFGEIFINKYLGNKITEVLNNKKKRVGWLWSTPNGQIIISPHLGFYLWYDPNGESWTVQSGALWLVKNKY